MRRRVLIYTETYGVGGSERFVADVVDNIDTDRIDCVLAGNDDPELSRYLQGRLRSPVERHVLRIAGGDPVPLVLAHRALGSRAGRSATAPAAGAGVGSWSEPDRPPELLRRAGRLLRDASGYQRAPGHLVRLARLFRQLRPDVLHVNNGGYPAARSCQVAPIAARLAGVQRVVTVVHGYPVAPGPLARVDRRLDRLVDRCTDRWVTAARGSADQLATVRGIAPEKISIVYLGQQLLAPVDSSGRTAVLTELGLDPGVPTVFLIGSFTANKGQSVALDALTLLRREGQLCRLVLVGDGSDRPALEARIRRDGLDGSVTLLGFRNDVERLLAGCDVLLSASTETELLPYVVKEAMARGLPTVATRVGGTPELVVDGETGILIPPKDAVAMAAAIERLLRDAPLRATLGRAGRARIRDVFGVEQMMDGLYAAYEGRDAPC